MAEVPTVRTGEERDLALLEHRRPLIWGAGLLGLFALVCWVLAKTTTLFPGPSGLDFFGTRADLPAAVRYLLDAERALAHPVVAASATIGIAAFCARRVSAKMCLAALVAPFVVVVASGAKDALGPPTALPSGHAAYAIAVFGIASWLCWRAGRWSGAAVLALVALSMGPARVIQGAHYAIDVIAGAALGLAWLITLLVWGTPRHSGHVPR
jgi:membrane-associated phospholipid phosphatase